ncbi:MAG: hypothetical protein HC854_16505 [Flavobacterium sp.]|nr:hypothetical protein [Flavobacterium sp.]
MPFYSTFSNCEKEIYDDAIQADKKNFTFKTITFKELNKIDKKTSSKILELKSKQENNLLDKTSEMYGFLVDTTSIIHLEKEKRF